MIANCQTAAKLLYRADRRLSVVIVRDREGKIRAFNSCRHRGSHYLHHGEGHAGASGFALQWTYDLDGKLLFARMADDFDPGSYSLKPVACEAIGLHLHLPQ